MPRSNRMSYRRVKLDDALRRSARFGERFEESRRRSTAFRSQAEIEIKKQPVHLNIDGCPAFVREQLVGLRLPLKRNKGSYDKPYPRSVAEARENGWRSFGIAPSTVVKALRTRGSVAARVAARWIEANTKPDSNITFELDAAEFI